MKPGASRTSAGDAVRSARPRRAAADRTSRATSARTPAAAKAASAGGRSSSVPVIASATITSLGASCSASAGSMAEKRCRHALGGGERACVAVENVRRGELEAERPCPTVERRQGISRSGGVTSDTGAACRSDFCESNRVRRARADVGDRPDRRSAVPTKRSTASAIGSQLLLDVVLVVERAVSRIDRLRAGVASRRTRRCAPAVRSACGRP